MPVRFIPIAFVSLVLVVAGLFVGGTWRAGRSLGEPRGQTLHRTQLAAGLVVLLLGVTAVLAARGVLQDFSALPLRMGLVMVAATVLTVVVARSVLGQRLADGIHPAALVAFQSFRVPVELILFALYREGIVPRAMTFEGRNLDALSGLSALGMAVWMYRGTPSRTAVRVWNAFGLALLGNIVAIAVLSMPTPLRVFHEGPANTFIAGWPYVWLPTFLVQAALFGHLVSLRATRVAKAG